MTIRRRVLVTGRVQGVAFRAHCARAATAAGVGGWVRNLADGRVEALFEGSPGAVEEMVKWCQRGPPGARVLGIQAVDDQGADGGGPEFVVRSDG